MKEETTATKVKRDGSGTVSVYIPQEGTGDFLEGAINGVNFRIPTGKVVEVSVPIANVIAESRRGILEGERAVETYAKQGGRRIG